MISKLEEATDFLIAYKLITSTTGSLSDRTRRRMEDFGVEAYELLKKRKKRVVDFKGRRVSLKWNDDQASRARNISLAIEEFRQAHPKLGKELDRTIEKHRNVRRAYLEFEGEVPEEVYIGIVREVMEGVTLKEARQIYRSILVMEKGLERERGPSYIILPE